MSENHKYQNVFLTDSQPLEIGIGSVLEHIAIRDLCLVHLPWFEFHFTLQINVSCCENSYIEVGVNAAHRQLQFRMVCNDLIRSLIESVTVFPLKVGTSLVAGRARSTLDTAKNDFPTGIGFFFFLQW